MVIFPHLWLTMRQINPEEEPIIPLVPCPPPIWVPPGDDVKVGRFENQTVDFSIQRPSNSYDPHPTKENLEWFNNTWSLR